MKVFVIAHRKKERKPEDFQPLVEAEDRRTFEYYRDGLLREVYSRSDGQGAIGVLECDSMDHARRLIADLPMVKAGLLDVDIYGAAPYRAIAQLAGQQ